MANIEDKDLENILIKTEAPNRVEAKENTKKRVAKLTGRTISSLRTKIKENRLEKAYSKYNRKYQKMKEAAKAATTARKEQEAGQDITNSELAVEYSIVASYDKKLAKMGAKLLKDDIKTVVAGMDISNTVAIGKRIKVPRFLLTKMRGLVQTVEKIRTKKEKKRLEKVMTKQTKEYIKNSLDSAVFKDDGSLQDKIDPEVIKNLGLKGGKNDTERRLDTLKGFISLDGKNALFENKVTDDDELEKESKSNTDLPPSEPEASVEKGEEKVKVDDLLKGLSKKEEITKHEKWEQMFKKIDAGLEVDYKDDEKIKSNIIETPTSISIEDKVSKEEQKSDKSVDLRRQEVDAIVRCNDRIAQLKSTLRSTKDADVRSILEEAIEKEKQEMAKIVGNRVGERTSEQTIGERQDTVTMQNAELNKISEHNHEEKTMEPIVVTEKKKDTKGSVMTNVEMKKPEQIRASQVSRPVSLRVTPQDIKNLEERKKNAQVKIASLKAEKEQLEQDKAMLKEYIEQARMTQAVEQEANKFAESIAPLRGEVAQLNSQVAEINKDLGRSK